MVHYILLGSKKQTHTGMDLTELYHKNGMQAVANQTWKLYLSASKYDKVDLHIRIPRVLYDYLSATSISPKKKGVRVEQIILKDVELNMGEKRAALV
jgi:hypothetical protein